MKYKDPIPNHLVNLRTGPTREGHWTKKRSTWLPSDPRAYVGGNLVFVVGAGRSGTTWVLKLLEEHPEVLAATVDNLDVRVHTEKTLETGVFHREDLTDNELRKRFWSLSKSNPDKIVVEKTPMHLMHVDRIMRVFPKAALVLVRRGGRDTFASMLAAGRDEDSWWKGAPRTAKAAAEMWREYAVATSRCEGCYNPYVIHFEELHADPVGFLTRLLDVLGLDDSDAPRIVDACEGGKNIHIKGVFRRGRVGGWKDTLSGEDLETFEVVAGRWDWKPDATRDPAVTVILSSFERPEGLERSFRSLVRQTMWKDIEVIICDDGSRSPRVKELLQRYGSNARVTVIRGEAWPVERKERFCTFTQLINRAMHVARGRYISYLPDGDEYRPGRCERYVDLLDRRDALFLVWSRSQWLRDGRRQPHRGYQAASTRDARRVLPSGNFIDHGEFMHRRTCVRWSTSPDSWRFADWLFLQRLMLGDVRFASLNMVGQVKHYDEDSLGRAMGEGRRSFRWVHARRTECRE